MLMPKEVKQQSCFKCSKKLKSAFNTENAPPMDASVFWGGWTYGSRFDALASELEIEINICDNCIEEALKIGTAKEVMSIHCGQ